MTMFKYIIPNPGKNYCGLQKVENGPAPGSFSESKSLKPWPDDVRFHMDPNHPKAIALADMHYNLANAMVVSKALQEFLAARSLTLLEYLPVSIVDHKGRVASSDYFVVNPVRPQECIDIETSGVKWNPLNPEKIVSCKRLTIDPKRIEPGVRLFRMKYLGAKTVVASDLATEIEGATFKGVTFAPIS